MLDTSPWKLGAKLKQSQSREVIRHLQPVSMGTVADSEAKHSTLAVSESDVANKAPRARGDIKHRSTTIIKQRTKPERPCKSKAAKLNASRDGIHVLPETKCAADKRDVMISLNP